MSMPLEQSTMITCAECDDQLQHCHGTAIMLEGATHVCSDDPECTLDLAEHWFISLLEE
jgi:hypothetical protein